MHTRHARAVGRPAPRPDPPVRRESAPARPLMTIDPDAFDAFEAAGWETAATAYDEFFAGVTGHAVGPLLDAAGVTAGKRVLDAATGPGYVAAAASERSAAVVGIDVAAAMVELARRKY